MLPNCVALKADLFANDLGCTNLLSGQLRNDICANSERHCPLTDRTSPAIKTKNHSMFNVIVRTIALVLLFTWALQLHARPYDEVIELGKLRVFAYSDYAPYSWVDNDDQPHGIDVEIARKFGEELGVEVEFLIRGADESIDDDLRVNIWKGDLIHRRAADVMMHVPFDREVDTRNEFVVLTAPYFQEQMAIVVNTDMLPTVDTFGRFVSNPIAVELDTAGDFFLSNAFRGQLLQSVQRGRTFADAQALFTSGEVGALLGSRAQAEWVAFNSAGLNTQIMQPPMPGIVRTGWPVGIAIKHDSRDLGYALGDVLTELVNSGEMQRIFSRYGVQWIAPELK